MSSAPSIAAPETEAAEEASLCQLMHDTYQVALKIAYSTTDPNRCFFDLRDESEYAGLLPFTTQQDDLWSWVDGLMHKYYHGRAEGRCSLAATISFDVAEFEAQVRRDLELYQSVYQRLTPCRRMTVEEMRARGYVWPDKET